VYQEKKAYGLGIINSYLPTPRALRYLNWFRGVGWHRCGAAYQRRYPQGDEGVLALFTVSGEGCLDMDGRIYHLAAGTAAVVPHRTPMKYGTGEAGEWEFYWINMHGPAVIPAAENMAEDKTAVFRPSCMPACVQIVRELIGLEDPRKYRFEMEVSRRIARLFELLLADRFFSDQERAEESLSDRAAAYLEAHYGEKILLDDLSRTLYVSRNQLIRVFQKEMGYTPYEYLKRYRLLKACELLQITDLPVNQIGQRTGFLNSSNFSSQFHRQYGMTPQDYRRIYGEPSSR
jgi:AraC-like DNA-binding protein